MIANFIKIIGHDGSVEYVNLNLIQFITVHSTEKLHYIDVTFERNFDRFIHFKDENELNDFLKKYLQKDS